MMSAVAAHPALLLSYDRLDYMSAWALQRVLVEDRLQNRRLDTLILLEHNPVFTIGRSGQPAHWGGDERLLNQGFPVHHVERGGSITYHGPGQLVGYPILGLSRFCAGPKAYMRLLEEVLIRTLAVWHLDGHRRDKLTGVWVGDEKIAAMGVRIIRGVTMHGFSLNVTMDLSPFEQITPCGIPNCRVTSMAHILGVSVPVATVRAQVAQVFAELFNLEWIDGRGNGEPMVRGSDSARREEEYERT
jgi:lipoyl(octanoyl) transferase